MAYAERDEVIIKTDVYAAIMYALGVAAAVCPRLMGSDKATLSDALAECPAAPIDDGRIRETA